jgi:glycosyltransferase involved in cell wall biosynthesis
MVSNHPAQTYVDLYVQLAKSDSLQFRVLYARDTTKGFRDHGFDREIRWDIDLLAGYDSEFLESKSPHYVSGRGVKNSRLMIPSLAMSRETIRVIRRLRPDVILIPGHGDLWYLLVWVICRVLNIPYIVRGTGVVEHKVRSIRNIIGARIARAFIGRATVFCYVGIVNYYYGLANGARSFVFSPYAISSDRFARPFVGKAARESMRVARGLDPELPVLVFCGKLQPWKRPQDLLLALPKIKVPTQAVFLGDGPMRKELERLAAELEVKVHFAGFVNQSDIPDWYALGDVLVLPSGHGGDTWGLSVNEALSLGLTPVVSNAVPSWPDLAWGEGGVFPVSDIDRLADCIVRALQRREDPGHHRALQAIQARYSIEAAAHGIEAAVRQALRSEARAMKR